jgi:hypothetical protein
MSTQENPLHTSDLVNASPAPGPESPASGDDGRVALFGERAKEFDARWTEVQSQFVDDPRHAVEEADGLVAEVITELADSFSKERSRLEEQWAGGEQVSTEDLRVGLQRYRSFFHRLLAS